MPKIRVEAEGSRTPFVLMRTVHDVDRYVVLMRAKADRKILVGPEGGELRPYEEWRTDQIEQRIPGMT